jgi:hypothetical protein
MHRTFLLVLAVPLICLATNANANCTAPPPVKDARKEADTAGATAKLWGRLDDFGNKVNVQIEKKEIFTGHPNADQVVVLLTALYNICASNYTEDEKLERQIAITKLFTSRVYGPLPIVSTAPSSKDIALSIRQNRRSCYKKSPPTQHPRRVLTWEGPVQNCGRVNKKPSWVDIYLSSTPFYITEQNKYFVAVGYASMEADGKRKLARLKRKFLKYDFQLHEPYGVNKRYEIMIASWVSKRRAAEALRAARK